MTMDPIDVWILAGQLQRGEYVVLSLGGAFIEFNFERISDSAGEGP